MALLQILGWKATFLVVMQAGFASWTRQSFAAKLVRRFSVKSQAEKHSRNADLPIFHVGLPEVYFQTDLVESFYSMGGSCRVQRLGMSWNHIMLLGHHVGRPISFDVLSWKLNNGPFNTKGKWIPTNPSSLDLWIVSHITFQHLICQVPWVWKQVQCPTDRAGQRFVKLRG